MSCHADTFEASDSRYHVVRNAPVPASAASDRVKRLRSLIRRFRLNVTALEGNVGGSSFRTIVADDGSVLPYFASLIYPGGYTEQPVGAVAATAARRLARYDADLAVIGANQYLLPLYSRQEFRFVPKFVRTFIPVTDGLEATIEKLSKAHRQDLRRSIRRMLEAGIECEISTDPSMFDRFYYDMYRPYAITRHGNLARMYDYKRLKSGFSRGFLFVIKKDAVPVAGAIGVRCGSTLCNSYMGITGGKEAMVREGISTALYYYSIQYAYSSGYTAVDFGNSRPFLSDGPLRYKLKWGMQVADVDDGIGVYAIATPGCTEQAKAFLSRNKFFELTSKGIQLCDDY